MEYQEYKHGIRIERYDTDDGFYVIYQNNQYLMGVGNPRTAQRVAEEIEEAITRTKEQIFAVAPNWEATNRAYVRAQTNVPYGK